MAYSGGSIGRNVPSQPYAYANDLTSDSARAHNMDNFSQNASTGFSLPGLSFSNSVQGPGSEQTPINLDDDDDEDYYGESSTADVVPQAATAGLVSTAPLTQHTLAQKEGSHAVRGGPQSMNGVKEQDAGRELHASSSSFSLPGLGSFSNDDRVLEVPRSAPAPPVAQTLTPARQASAYVTVNTTRPSNARMDHERVITAFQGKYAFAIETLRQLHECGISFEQLLALDLFSERDKVDLAQLFVQAGLSSGNPPSVRDVNEQLLRLVNPTIGAVPEAEASRPLPRSTQASLQANDTDHSTSNGPAQTLFQQSRSPGSLTNGSAVPEAPVAQTSVVAPMGVGNQTNAPVAATIQTAPSSSANAGPADRSTYLARLQAAKLKKSPLTSQRTSPVTTTNPTPVPAAASVLPKPGPPTSGPASGSTNAANLASSVPSANPLSSVEASVPRAPDRLDKIRQKMEQLRAQMAQGKTAGNLPVSGSATPPTTMATAIPSDISAPPQSVTTADTQEVADLDQSDVEMEEDEDSDDSDEYEPEIPSQPEPITPHVSSIPMPANDIVAIPSTLASQSNTPTPAAADGLNPYEQALKAKEAEISAMKERILARAKERLASAREANAQTPIKVTAQQLDAPNGGQEVSQTTTIDLTGEDTTPRRNGDAGLPPRPQANSEDIPGLTNGGPTTATPVSASLPTISGATSRVLDRGRQVSYETPKRTATSPLRNGSEDKRQRINESSTGKSTPVPMSAKARRLLEIQEEMRRVQEALNQEEAARERLVQELDAFGVDTEGKSLEELEEIQQAMQQAAKPSTLSEQTPNLPELREQSDVISGEAANNATIDHQPPVSAQPTSSFEVDAPSAIYGQSAPRPSSAQQLLDPSNIQGDLDIMPTQPQGDDSVPMQIEISDDSTESDTAESGDSSEAMSIDNEDIHTPGEPIDGLIAPTEIVEASQPTRLHVKNLPYSATEEDIRSFFDQFTLEDIEICTHPQSGRSKGFGFVTLPSLSDAQLAIQQLDAHRMGSDTTGRQIKLRIAKSNQVVSSAADVNSSTMVQEEDTAVDAEDDDYEPSAQLDSRTDEINRLPEKVVEDVPVQESEDLTDESMNESSDEGEVSEPDITEVPAPRAPPTGPRNPHPASFQPSNSYPTPPTGPRAYVQQGYAPNPNNALPRSGPYLGRPLYPILGLKYPENAPKVPKAADSSIGASTDETETAPDTHVYDSPLKNFKSYRYHPDYNKTHKYQSLTYSHKLDADLPLCPTELQNGECPDKDCIFQHFSQAKLDGSSLLAELGGRNPEPTLDNAVYAGGLRELIKDMKARSLDNTEDICSEIVTYSNGSKKDPTRVLTI